MIFNITRIKTTFMDVEPFASNSELRDEFKKIFNLEFLFSNNIVNSICFFNQNLHISSDSANILLDYVNNKFNTSFNIEQLKQYGKYSNEKLEFLKIQSFEDFKYFFGLSHKEKIEKEEQVKRQFEAPLPLDLTNKKLLSIDFEYRQTKENIEIHEMGITVSFNNDFSYFHYMTEAKKLNYQSFNFGESIVINKEDFLPIFESHLTDIDYIIGHSINMEYKVLTANKFDCSKIDFIPFIDTSVALRNEFNIYKNGKKRNQKESLALQYALKAFEIEFSNLHNAGNDSAYSLLLAHALIAKKNQHLSSGAKKKLIRINI